MGTVPVNKLYGTAPAIKVPTVVKFDKDVNVVFVVAVIFPAVVAVKALPVILPAIALVTVKFANVPTLVKLEPVIVDFNVVPVKVPASAVTVISPLPSNATPFIFLDVANFVAVLAVSAVVAVVALVAVVAVAALPVVF